MGRATAPERTNMRELYNVTMTDVIDTIAEDVMAKYNVSKAKARKLVCNALIYNCVTEEVLGQVDFLMGGEE